MRLSGGLLVHSAYLHHGAIRNAIHALKYRGLDPVAKALAPLLVELLPEAATALIPIPRSTVRLLRYGIDQARTLADHLGRYSGIPVLDALRAPVFRTSQLHRRTRHGLAFRLVRPVPAGAVLVDDVITTGTTLDAAGLACGPAVRRAVTVSRAALRW